MSETHQHGLWTHDHHFLGHGHERAESRARLAAGVTAVFMVIEIAAGLEAKGSLGLANIGKAALHVFKAGCVCLFVRNVNDGTAGFGRCHYELRELVHTDFRGAAKVIDLADGSVIMCDRGEAFNDIEDVSEAARLLATAVNGDSFP